MFFHGNGETGMGTPTDIQKADNAGLSKEVKEDSWDPQRRFIVLSPQMNGTTRTAVNVHDFIQFAKANYKVDTTRIYLTGLSGGGGPLYRYLQTYNGGEAAAMIAISTVYEFPSPENVVCNWKQVPAWFFHGSSDTTVTPGNSQRPFDHLFKWCLPLAVDPRYTLYTGVGHDAWTRTYDLTGMNSTIQAPGLQPYNQNIYDWLLQYQK